MRRTGWLLLALAAAAAAMAFVCQYVGYEDWSGPAIFSFIILMLLGGAFLSLSALMRFARGELRLRPKDALRSTVTVFAAIVGLKALFWVIFPDDDRNMLKALLVSAAFSAAYGLYSTAYRRTT